MDCNKLLQNVEPYFCAFEEIFQIISNYHFYRWTTLSKGSIFRSCIVDHFYRSKSKKEEEKNRF